MLGGSRRPGGGQSRGGTGAISPVVRAIAATEVRRAMDGRAETDMWACSS